MTKDCVLLVTSNCIGKGEEKLGSKLMNAYFQALSEGQDRPSYIIFMHEGVKLAVEGSPIVSLLQGLAEKGVQIFSCGTCLDYFNLKESLRAGQVGNMYKTRDILAAAGKIINLG